MGHAVRNRNLLRTVRVLVEKKTEVSRWMMGCCDREQHVAKYAAVLARAQSNYAGYRKSLVAVIWQMGLGKGWQCVLRY
ncbi:hypothetical protein AS9A_2667 [Hoyosella subflava DQS3-9A1]|uniref:Transposase n=1 Tax=Hoyosella subflava (strain DSM 45089 / JCM 17490 / NBRC 109087 / DQS3-9A1) TaxID=443218 RepID=F6EHD5_HOYSD|nr:hypothetical protein AS9A_2667 [Hoyosella subflava DQS3-9A1]